MINDVRRLGTVTRNEYETLGVRSGPRPIMKMSGKMFENPKSQPRHLGQAYGWFLLTSANCAIFGFIGFIFSTTGSVQACDDRLFRTRCFATGAKRSAALVCVLLCGQEEE